MNVSFTSIKTVIFLNLNVNSSNSVLLFISEFKTSRSPILIATDVAARGLGAQSNYSYILFIILTFSSPSFPPFILLDLTWTWEKHNIWMLFIFDHFVPPCFHEVYCKQHTSYLAYLNIYMLQIFFFLGQFLFLSCYMLGYKNNLSY